MDEMHSNMERYGLIRAVGFALGLCVLGPWGATAHAFEDVDSQIPVQGTLATSNGMPRTDPVDLSFELFNAQVGGQSLFIEDFLDVTLDEAGRFAVRLGSQRSLASEIFRENPVIWVEIAVDGEPLTDRIQLGAAPFAQMSQYANLCAEVIPDAIGEEQIQAGAVGTAEIATGAVGQIEIATGGVGPDEIALGAVGADKIAMNAVGSVQLADNAVDNGAMQDDSVGSAEIRDNSVGNAEMQDDAIRQPELADNAVGNAEMRDDAIGRPELQNDAVGAQELADGAVDTAALQNDAVNSAKIADDAVTAAGLQDDAVDTEAIQDDAVTAPKIADGAVGTGAIQNGAVTGAKVANASITAEKLSGSGFGGANASNSTQFTVDSSNQLQVLESITLTSPVAGTVLVVAAADFSVTAGSGVSRETLRVALQDTDQGSVPQDQYEILPVAVDLNEPFTASVMRAFSIPANQATTFYLRAQLIGGFLNSSTRFDRARMSALFIP